METDRDVHFWLNIQYTLTDNELSIYHLSSCLGIKIGSNRTLRNAQDLNHVILSLRLGSKYQTREEVFLMLLYCIDLWVELYTKYFNQRLKILGEILNKSS